jgi:hypothetical protein
MSFVRKMLLDPFHLGFQVGIPGLEPGDVMLPRFRMRLARKSSSHAAISRLLRKEFLAGAAPLT